MTTLRNRLTAATFWGDHVCLRCLHIGHEEGDECPECGAGGYIEAALLQRVIEGLDEPMGEET